MVIYIVLINDMCEEGCKGYWFYNCVANGTLDLVRRSYERWGWHCFGNVLTCFFLVFLM